MCFRKRSWKSRSSSTTTHSYSLWTILRSGLKFLPQKIKWQKLLLACWWSTWYQDMFCLNFYSPTEEPANFLSTLVQETALLRNLMEHSCSQRVLASTVVVGFSPPLPFVCIQSGSPGVNASFSILFVYGREPKTPPESALSQPQTPYQMSSQTTAQKW